MKRSQIIPIIILFIALIFGIDRYFRLSSNEARALALHLANRESQVKFKLEPFQDQTHTRFEDGRWLWSGSSGVGNADLRAEVSFDAYGRNPKTKLWIMTSTLDDHDRDGLKNLDPEGPN
jgi:hypothetical protein